MKGASSQVHTAAMASVSEAIRAERRADRLEIKRVSQFVDDILILDNDPSGIDNLQISTLSVTRITFAFFLFFF